MSKPRLLDLFCGAGGAAVGYHRAGFEVVGVDIHPQPNYPFHFWHADALEIAAEPWALSAFDAVHASPPCQRFSTASAVHSRLNPARHPDFLTPVRRHLRAAGVLYIIENVRGAPMESPVRLCGSSFGLDLERHRLFEVNWPVLVPPCAHGWQTPRFRSLDKRQKVAARVVGVHGHLNYTGEALLRSRAMEINWMTQAELVEAIPPAYTELLGSQLLGVIGR
jgi:DNA (cytosine-5)-methyltransferase 1